MFERFTEKAIKVIMLAQEEARRLGHNFIGTEQFLLGLIGKGTGIAGKALKEMGANLKEARTETEKIIGRVKIMPDKVKQDGYNIQLENFNILKTFNKELNYKDLWINKI